MHTRNNRTDEQTDNGRCLFPDRCDRPTGRRGVLCDEHDQAVQAWLARQT